MKRIKIFLCILTLSAAISGTSWAIPISFDLDASNSSVALSNVSEDGIHMSASLYSGLENTAFTLGDNESYTFDFLTLTTNVNPGSWIGWGSADISATLVFEFPTVPGGVSGSGDTLYGQLFGVISGTGLIWGPVKSPVLLPAGDYFDISFNNVLNFSSITNVTATITAHAASPAPVPEPATMLLLGAGLFGLLMIGRKKTRMDS